MYIPGSILSLWLVQRHGLGKNILLGCLLCFLSSIIKYVGVLVPPPHLAYGVVLFGQVVGAFGQPMLLNVAARLSSDWFPDHERDFATTAATMSNILGQMVASFLPAVICGTTFGAGASEQAVEDDLARVMLYQVKVRSSEPLPPCAAPPALLRCSAPRAVTRARLRWSMHAKQERRDHRRSWIFPQ